MYRCISAYPFIIVLSLLLLALSFYSYTCWVLTISVLNLTIFPCYSNLLLRRRGWTAILRQGVLGYVLPQLSFLLCYGVFHYFVPLRIIIVFRDTIYVIIILYSWYLVICEHFWPYVWNNWSWVMHTMNTWLWHKNRVWQPPIRVPPLECTAVPDLEPRRHQRPLSGELAPRRHHHPSLHLRDLQGQRQITTSHCEPPSAVRTPPRRPPSTTSPASDLIGESCRHSSCPVYSSRHPCAHATDHATRELSVSPHRPWHRIAFGHGDCAPPRPCGCRALCTVGPPRRLGQAARWATAPWRPTTTAGRQPTPHRDLGPKAGPQAKNDFSFSKIL
jgi:hypothetical protein